jgi:hypothetical protein
LVGGLRVDIQEMRLISSIPQFLNFLKLGWQSLFGKASQPCHVEPFLSVGYGSLENSMQHFNVYFGYPDGLTLDISRSNSGFLSI